MSTQSHTSLPTEQYLTVAQAARLLSVHASTIRRWIDQGKLPAYRVGERRIGVRQADLAQLVSPRTAGQEKGERMVKAGQDTVRPLADEDQKEARQAIAEVRRLRAETLAARGGELFPSSADLINEARDERTRDRAW